jgi:hypothetical protein
MKKKILVAAAILAAVTTLGVAPAIADNLAPYTGWSIDGGSPRYYVNGNLVTNCWVKYGSFYYLVDDKGYTIPDRVLSEDVVKVMPVAFVDSNGTPVHYEVQNVNGALVYLK